MNPITQTKLAQLAGVSKQAVSKVALAGRLTKCMVNGKEKIDLDGALTQEYIKFQQQSQEERDIEKALHDEEIGKAFAAIREKPHTTRSIPSEPTEYIRGERELKKKKLEAQIEEIKIKNQQKRGALIPKNLVVRIFNKIYAIDEDMLKPIGVDISPKISAIYNSANAAKTTEILKYFKSESSALAKSEIQKILNANEPDRITEMNQVIEDSIGHALSSIKREVDKFLDRIESDEK